MPTISILRSARSGIQNRASPTTCLCRIYMQVAQQQKCIYSTSERGIVQAIDGREDGMAHKYYVYMQQAITVHVYYYTKQKQT